MVHSVSGCTRGVQVKLWDPLRTRAIPEHLRGVLTRRRYTNPRLPLPLPLPPRPPNGSPSKVYQKSDPRYHIRQVDSDISRICLPFYRGSEIRNLASIFDPSCLWVVLVWKLNNLKSKTSLLSADDWLIFCRNSVVHFGQATLRTSYGSPKTYVESSVTQSCVARFCWKYVS